MKRFKKVLRLAGLILMIMLASFGIGLTGAAPIFTGNRERHLNNEINTEMVDKEDKEDETTLKEVG